MRLYDSLSEAYAIFVVHERVFRPRYREVYSNPRFEVPYAGDTNDRDIGLPWALSPYGGRTIVYLYPKGSDGTQPVGYGEARCHPKDRFVKSIGLEIACQRAKASLETP